MAVDQRLTIGKLLSSDYNALAHNMAATERVEFREFTPTL